MALSGIDYLTMGSPVKMTKKALLDGREEYATLAEMAAAKDMQMPEMLIGICHEDQKVYLFNKKNTKDPTLGKWRLLTADVKLNVKFEDVSLEEAEPYVLYVVGENIRYTRMNRTWIYVNVGYLAEKVVLEDLMPFDGENTEFDLPDALSGLTFEFYINGIRRLEGHDYQVDRTVTPNRIKLDTVYDDYDYGQFTYYNNVEIRSIELVDNILAKAFHDTYFNQYPGQTITPASPEFDNDAFYACVGNYTEQLPISEITFGEFEIDSTPRSILIGDNSHIEAPLWKLEDGMLYVAAPLLVIISSEGASERSIINANHSRYGIVNKHKGYGEIHLKSVVPLNAQPGYTCSATIDEIGNVQFISGHGAQGVGLIFEDENGDELEADDILYRLNTLTLDIGLQNPREEYGVFVSYARYPNLNDNQPYITPGGTIMNNKLYCIGKASTFVSIGATYVVD